MKRKGKDIRGSYLGLNPKSFVLSSYHCPTCHQAFSSNNGIMIFCPSCGVPAKAESRISASSVSAFKALNCKVCTSELYTDLEPEVVASGKLFCPECGAGLKVKAEDEEYDDEMEDDEIEDMSEDVEELDEEADIDDLEGIDDLEEEDESIMAEVIGGDDEDTDDEDSEDSDEDTDDEDSEDSEEDTESDDEDSEGSDEDSEENTESDDEDSEDSEDSEKAESAITSSMVKRILSSPLSDRSNITFDLWKFNDGNMIRNVVISGIPIARIHLQDQEQPEELSKVFPNKVYEDTLVEQMERKPVKEVLHSAEARLFSFAESKQKPVEQQVATRVNQQLNSFRKKFKETFLAVMSGANKNLFNDVTNTLKQELWTAIAEQGVDRPESIIEPAFDNASEPFLDQVFDKTIALMEKGDDVRKEIIQMVESSGTIALANTEDQIEEDSLRSKLVKASFPVAVSSAGVGSQRSDLRSRLNLRHK